MPRHITETGFNQINLDAYASLAAAVSAIGSNEKELMVGQNATVSSNLTIPENVALKIQKGAIISVDNGVTLTLECTISAGPYEIFGGSGITRIAGSLEVYPEWWGAVGDGTTDDSSAIQAALDSLEYDTGGTLLLSSKTYYVGSTTIEWQAVASAGSLTIRGVGKYVGSSIKANGASIVLDFIGSDRLVLENFRIETSGACDVGILLARRHDNSASSGIILNNVSVVGEFTKAAIYSINSEVNRFVDCEIRNTSSSGLSYGLYTSTENDLNVSPNNYTIGEEADGWTNSVINICGGSVSHYGSDGCALGVFGNTRLVNVSGTYLYSDAYDAYLGASTANSEMGGPINFEECSFEGTSDTKGIYVGDVTLYGLNVNRCVFSLSGAGSYQEIYQEDTSLGIQYSKIRDNRSAYPTNYSFYRILRSEIGNAEVQLRSLGYGMEWVDVTLNYESSAQDQGALRRGLVSSATRRVEIGPPPTTVASDYSNNSSLVMRPVYTDPSPAVADKGLVVPWSGQYSNQPNGQITNKDGMFRPYLSYWTGYEYLPISSARQELYLSALPESGPWTRGDIVWHRDALDDEVPFWQCVTGGYAYKEEWYAGGTYVTDDRVLGSDGYVYEAVADGGQAEDPVDDSDNTYWEQEGIAVEFATPAKIYEDGYLHLDPGMLPLQSEHPDYHAAFGIVYSKASDPELYFRDSYGNITQITDDGKVKGNTLDQAYDEGGSGSTILADSGPVYINAGGADALELDGYLTLVETTEPDELGNSGLVYTKEADGYVELHYKNDGGTAMQMTSNGNPLLPSYTISTLPSVTPAGQMIYVTDETGGAVPAFSDGSDWRRVTDRNVVS